ncbi:GTP-binding signal recognition particle SRP54, G- domain [Thermosinus carboxydivorans Nor1]|uniref:Flagellar biosynthesis protein FlhF n=1 Tax=Thermosinus carboxydivorans Nor1 TaxID=401526 RepID=A1HN19_9FIRM|nr:flagellar biosynthesis protein FlhF [Thermosinus carboxydivorans]EAX48647.1 GTP-binding signal recognition particle SRP54, G- domain [Thermosinus carboxydivorans Nor1]
MRVKLYTASTINDAMAQVKSELGRDAVILHTRKFRKGGFFGFFGKEMVEVMAAVDTPPVGATALTKAVPVRPSGEDEAKTVSLQLELANMRRLLEQLVSKMPQQEQRLSPLYQLLVKNDVEPDIARNLVQGLPDDNSIIGASQPIVRQLLFDRLCNYFQKIEGITIPQNGTKVVALIGPTGVGKTTTIAKLAANFALRDGYKVALITADTYRIAAVEQLKTYADIIGIPIEIVYTPDEMKAALYRHRDKHLVLIDTAGRSPNNQYQLAELQALLSVDPYIDTHLVLSTTTKYKDALELVKKFSVCSPQKFLFTKIDEASNLGTVLNLLYQFPTKLSYVTNGQNVPDDIELANPSKLVNLILRD